MGGATFFIVPRIDAFSIISGLLQNRSEGGDALRRRIKETLANDLHVDEFQFAGADPLMQALFARGFRDQTGFDRPRSAGAAENAYFNIDVLLASLMHDHVAEDGTIDRRVIAAELGEEAAKIFDEAAATKTRPATFSMNDHPGLMKIMSRVDQAMQKRISEYEGVPKSMPLLDASVAALKGERPFENYNAVMVQHLFGGQLPFFEAMEAGGLNPEDTQVLGRGYSDTETVRELGRIRGYRVEHAPESKMGDYHRDMEAKLRKILSTAIARSKQNGKKILLIDDGGMAIRMVHTEFREFASLFSCVEQTSRGITELEGLELAAPVVNVARSKGKEMESPYIAEVVVEKLMGDLRALSRAELKGRRVTIFGFGFIGRALARELRDMGAQLSIYEKDPNKIAEAQKEGFTAHHVNDLDFGDTEMVIGTTGHRSLGKVEIDALPDNVILASTSSAEVEFDLDYLQFGAYRRELPFRGGHETNHKTWRFQRDGRSIVLLNEGRPVNFDGDVVGVAPHKIQLTHALMFEGAVQAVRSLQPGINALKIASQDRLLSHFEKILEDEDPEGIVEIRERRNPSFEDLPALPKATDSTAVFKQKIRRFLQEARLCEDVILQNGAALLPKDPFTGRAQLVTCSTQIVDFHAPDGVVTDFQLEGNSFWLRCRGPDGRYLTHIFDRPPLVHDQDRRELHSVATAIQRAALPPQASYRVSLDHDDGALPKQRHVLTYPGSWEQLNFFDLMNGESGAIKNLPPGATILSGAPIATNDSTLYFLSKDFQTVERSIELDASFECTVFKIKSRTLLITQNTKSTRCMLLSPSADTIEAAWYADLPKGSRVTDLFWLYGIHNFSGERKLAAQIVDAAGQSTSLELDPKTHFKGENVHHDHRKPHRRRTPDRASSITISRQKPIPAVPPDYFAKFVLGTNDEKKVAFTTLLAKEGPQQSHLLTGGEKLELYGLPEVRIATPPRGRYAGRSTLLVRRDANNVPLDFKRLDGDIFLTQVSNAWLRLHVRNRSPLNDDAVFIIPKSFKETSLHTYLQTGEIGKRPKIEYGKDAIYVLGEDTIDRFPLSVGEAQIRQAWEGLFESPGQVKALAYDAKRDRLILLHTRPTRVSIIDPQTLKLLKSVETPRLQENQITEFYVDEEGSPIVSEIHHGSLRQLKLSTDFQVEAIRTLANRTWTDASVLVDTEVLDLGRLHPQWLKRLKQAARSATPTIEALGFQHIGVDLPHTQHAYQTLRFAPRDELHEDCIPDDYLPIIIRGINKIWTGYDGGTWTPGQAVDERSAWKLIEEAKEALASDLAIYEKSRVFGSPYQLLLAALVLGGDKVKQALYDIRDTDFPRNLKLETFFERVVPSFCGQETRSPTR